MNNEILKAFKAYTQDQQVDILVLEAFIRGWQARENHKGASSDDLQREQLSPPRIKTGWTEERRKKFQKTMAARRRAK